MVVEPAAKWQSYDGRRFAFLNIEDEFRGWNNTAHGMLWAYNQNYMDWLCQPGMTAADGQENTLNGPAPAPLRLLSSLLVIFVPE